MDSIEIVPGYEGLGRIAEGGMATVWLARQLSLDRRVAIKILSPDFARNEEARRRFYREARAAALLNHPGIVQIYDAGEHAGSVFMVMEYVHGFNIADLLDRRKRIAERHALLIAEGVALALEYAWNEARLIHCDIKPENVLVADDGSVKLTDLGLARFIGAHAEPDMIEGTPHYASPEQVMGEPDLDCRTDIYSLGAMLYHLVTGSLPFADSQGLSAMRRQLNDFLTDPLDLNPALSPNTAWLIEKMLVKDRARRYASWPDALGDIERVKAGHLPAIPPAEPGQSTVRRSGSRTWLAAPEIQPAGQPGAAAQSPAPPAAPKRVIVLPKNLRGRLAGRNAGPAGRDLAREAILLILMFLSVLTAYGALAYFHIFRDRSNAGTGFPRHGAVATETEPRRQPMGLPENPASALPVNPAPESAPAPSSSRNHPENWRHPTYLKGAHLFNDALETYTTYQKDKQNPEALPIIEQQCREAIEAFEFVRPLAPKELNIQRLIDQCYHLISDTRQSTLLLPAASPVQPGPPAAAQPEEHLADTLALAPSWNAPQPGFNPRISADLAALLEGVAAPNVDLRGDPSLLLFDRIAYLMPAQEAARIIGKPLGSRKRLITPGFPNDSFHYYTLSGEFADGFERIILIADRADRIAAVQLASDRAAGDLWLEAAMFNDGWSTHNLVEANTRTDPRWKIAWRAEKIGRLLRLDSELATARADGYFGLGISKARVSLFLPEPVADLILYQAREPRMK